MKGAAIADLETGSPPTTTAKSVLHNEIDF
jgi:hypothetical protein